MTGVFTRSRLAACRSRMGRLWLLGLCLAAVLPACARVGTSGGASSPVTPGPAPVLRPQAQEAPGEPKDQDTDSDAADQRAPATRTPDAVVPSVGAELVEMSEREAWLQGPDEIKTSAFATHADIQERIDFWMEFWQGRGRTYFARYLSRMATYQPLIDRGLMERDLPPTLRYLPLIESGYNPVAVSRVGATGLWQFMSPTARWLGLRVDGFVDERRDPFRSTDLALDYLVSLQEDFGSWYLTLAAYNSGPGRVGGILRRNANDAPRGDSLFWALSHKFPRETALYVPKLLAAAELATYPELYGFEQPNPSDSLTFERVDVEGTTSLDVVAEAANVSLEEVVALNPHLVQRVTPLNTLWSVRVPLGSRDGFAERLALIPPDERVTFIQHRVASGETLGHIAGDYGIRLSQLRAANPGVRPERLQIGQRLIIPKGPATSDSRVASAQNRSSQPATAEPADALTAVATRDGDVATTTHVVRSGDSPWSISRRYEVALDDLLKWNELNRRSVLRPGDRIQVRGVAQAQSTVASRPTRYRVQSGDTLSQIAEQHGVSTRSLMQHNGLSSRSVIKPGQTIQIPAAG